MPSNPRRENPRKSPRENEDDKRDDAELERERAEREEYHRDRFTTDDDDRAGRHWRMRTWMPDCTREHACGWCSNA